MHNLSISVKNNYVTLKIKNKTIRYLVTPALIGYKSVKAFDRTTTGPIPCTTLPFAKW